MSAIKTVAVAVGIGAVIVGAYVIWDRKFAGPGKVETLTLDMFRQGTGSSDVMLRDGVMNATILTSEQRRLRRQELGLGLETSSMTTRGYGL